MPSVGAGVFTALRPESLRSKKNKHAFALIVRTPEVFVVRMALQVSAP